MEREAMYVSVKIKIFHEFCCKIYKNLYKELKYVVVGFFTTIILVLIYSIK